MTQVLIINFSMNIESLIKYICIKMNNKRERVDIIWIYIFMSI